MNERFLTNRQVAQTCLRFQYFISAGTSVSEAFDLMAEDEQDHSMSQLFRGMADDAGAGYTAGELFEKAGVFPAHVCSLIRTGERTGRLEEALGAVAAYCLQQDSAQQQMKQAVVHPAALILVMLAVAAILLDQVLPVFQQVYSRLGAELSGAGALFLSAARVLHRIMPLVWIVFGMLAFLLGSFVFSDRFCSRVFSAWQKRGKGPWALAARAEFAMAFSMGISSGLQAEEAVRLALDLVQDVPSLKAAGDQCLELLSGGRSAADALKESGLTEGPYAGLLGAGFRSGRPEEAAEKGAQTLAEDAARALENRLASIEPALVLMLTLLLGGILLSVMLPLLGLMTSMG